MRLPFRLNLKLQLAHARRTFFGASHPDLVQQISFCLAQPTLQAGSTRNIPEFLSHEQCAVLLKQVSSPAVWIPDYDALHPKAGQLANELTQSGHHVFMGVTGLALRRRIHEFRPDAKLYLTLPFGGLQATHDRCCSAEATFAHALEGIRAAKLSGFLICAHTQVDTQTDPCEVGRLVEYLEAHDVDGIVVSPDPSAALTPALVDKLEQARDLIRCAFWEDFSRALQSSLARTAPNRAAAPSTDSQALQESA